MYIVILKPRSNNLIQLTLKWRRSLRNKAFTNFNLNAPGSKHVVKNGFEIGFHLYWHSLEDIRHWQQDAEHQVGATL